MKNTIYDRLAALSDPSRVRLLRVLEEQELGVGELVRVLGMAQSTVSRHLKTLRDGGWVASRSEGTANLFRLAVDALPAEAARLWGVVREQAGEGEPHASDLRRVRQLVALREADATAFFARHAGRWDGLRRDLFGDAFLLPTLLSLVDSDLVVGDLGCGTGEALAALAPVAGRVIGVDREPAMLEAAGQRLSGVPNVDLRLGSLVALPLKDAELDVALLMLVLHHVEDLQQAFAEVSRTLRPGGRLILLDMVSHDRVEYRRTMGHRHQGFSREQLGELAEVAGLRLQTWRALEPAPDAMAPGLFVAVIRAVGA
jgi:SAM-dependent methyltransferase